MTPIEAFDDVDENEDEINVDIEQEDVGQEAVDHEEEKEEGLNLNTSTQYGKHAINHLSATSNDVIIVSLNLLHFILLKNLKIIQKYQTIPCVMSLGVILFTNLN